MACDSRIRLLISCYADGEATAEESSRASAHLESCSECRKMVESWGEHRQMLEWAYTVELPEVSRVALSEEVAEMETRVPIVQKFLSLWRGANRRRSLAWVGIFVAVITVGFVYRILSLPPLLRVGDEMASGVQPQIVRMGSGIELKLEPESQIIRADRRTLRLKKGSVSASVDNSSGLRVLTRRLEVIDQGTRFRVGTGPKLDYVAVTEGSVSVRQRKVSRYVSAGQTLVAQDLAEPRIASFPEYPRDISSQISGGDEEGAFVPGTALELDWRDGVRRLAAKFPNVRFPATYSARTGLAQGHPLEYRIAYGEHTSLMRGLRARFAEVAQAMAGQTSVSEKWEIPVGVVAMHPAKMPNDVYYVRLAPKNGAVVWRLSGSRGGQFDFPLEQQKMEGQLPRITFSSYLKFYEGGREEQNETLIIGAWPWEAKPALTLLMQGTPKTESARDKSSMLALATRRTNLRDVDLKSSSVDLLYLDPERRHRILVAWNSKVGMQVARVYQMAKQGRGGSEILGAFVTDVPLKEPEAPSGVYLIKLVARPSQSPHLEVAVPDGGGAAVAGAWSEVLLSKSELDGAYSRHSRATESPAPYSVMLGYQTGPADEGAFPFRLEVQVHADEKPVLSAEGRIRLKKP